MTNSVGFGNARFGQDEFSTTAFVVQQILAGMATATLVKVVAVGAETVDVQPLVNQVDGRGTGTTHGIIHDLPFFSLRGGAAAVEALPRKDDIGAVVFCHSDISQVKATRGQANPGSRRKFDWADGLYLGGFCPRDAALVLLSVGAAGAFLTGSLDVSENLSVGTGATGTFAGSGGEVVTVQDGIVIGIGT